MTDGGAPEINVALPGAGAVFHERYRIVRALRAGGMGRVYEAVHLGTTRRCALKLMHPTIVTDARARARFEREATVTASIRSDHMVEVIDAGVDDETGLPFIVMELLVGEDLGELVRRRGRLPPAEVVDLLSQAAVALDRAHAVGVVHRDLKPGNLFVTTFDDGSPRIKLLDFGIAKILVDGASQHDASRVAGTPQYMAPEQVRGRRIRPGTDVYALGQIAFTLLVGSAYFADDHGDLYATLLRIGAGVDEPASARARRVGVELPAAFDAWFETATSRRPAQRYGPSSRAIAELARALGVPVPGRMLVDVASAAPSSDAAEVPTLEPVSVGDGAEARSEPLAPAGSNDTASIDAPAPPLAALPAAWPRRRWAVAAAVVVGAIVAGVILRPPSTAADLPGAATAPASGRSSEPAAASSSAAASPPSSAVTPPGAPPESVPASEPSRPPDAASRPRTAGRHRSVDPPARTATTAVLPQPSATAVSEPPPAGTTRDPPATTHDERIGF